MVSETVALVLPAASRKRAYTVFGPSPDGSVYSAFGAYGTAEPNWVPSSENAMSVTPTSSVAPSVRVTWSERVPGSPWLIRIVPVGGWVSPDCVGDGPTTV